MLFEFLAIPTWNRQLTIDILHENVSRSWTCHFYTFSNSLNDTETQEIYIFHSALTEIIRFSAFVRFCQPRYFKVLNSIK